MPSSCHHHVIICTQFSVRLVGSRAEREARIASMPEGPAKRAAEAELAKRDAEREARIASMPEGPAKCAAEAELAKRDAEREARIASMPEGPEKRAAEAEAAKCKAAQTAAIDAMPEGPEKEAAKAAAQRRQAAAAPGKEEVQVDLVLDMNLEELGAKAEEFKAAVVKDVCQAISGRPERVRVLSLRAGSVVLTLILEEGVCQDGRGAIEAAQNLKSQAADPSSALRRGQHTCKAQSAEVRVVKPVRKEEPGDAAAYRKEVKDNIVPTSTDLATPSTEYPVLSADSPADMPSMSMSVDVPPMASTQHYFTPDPPLHGQQPHTPVPHTFPKTQAPHLSISVHAGCTALYSRHVSL